MNSKKIRDYSISLLLASIIIFASATLYSAYQFGMMGTIKAEGPEDPLEAWSEASYVMWKYNTTHYAARNMSTLLVDYGPSTNISQIAQYVANSLTSGGEMFWKEGPYTLDSQVAITNDGITFNGEGKSSILYASYHTDMAASLSERGLFHVTGNDFTFKNLLLKSGHDPEVDNNYGIVTLESSDIKILDSYITSDDPTTKAWRIGIDFANSSNIEVSGLFADGANNVIAGRNVTNIDIHDFSISSPTDNCVDIGGRDIKIHDGSFYRTTFTGWANHEATMQAIYIVANTTDVQIDNVNINGTRYNGILVNEGGLRITISNSLITYAGHDSDGRGIHIDGDSGIPVRIVTINDNIIVGSGRDGIRLDDTNNLSITDNFSLNGGQTASGHGISPNNCVGGIISYNQCFDNQSTPTQDYGISWGGTRINFTIIGNVLEPNQLGTLNAPPTSGGIIHFNRGYVTENSGTSSIANGGTWVDVAHGLSVTPTAQYFTVIGMENSTNDVGTIWLGTPNATHVRVNVAFDPGASNWDFAWRAMLFP